MTNIRQAKKNRSSLPKAKPKKSGVVKSGRKKINVLGNSIIAENWDRKQTLTQNYRRLGLVHRLNAPAGGSERRGTTVEGYEEQPDDSLHIKSSAKATTKQLGLGEIKVERDPETGNIIRVIRPDDEIEVAGRKHKISNPLNDPLNDLSNDEARITEAAKQNDSSVIVQMLERQAAQEGKAVESKKPRHLSKREEEWATRLIERHGDDYSAMARDMKLNPMQQTAGDLKRRIRKFKESQS